MKLIFTERGEQVGTVGLTITGDLTGPAPWARMVRVQAQRAGVTLGEAMRALDGWSNGYLVLSLDDGAPSEIPDSAIATEAPS